MSLTPLMSGLMSGGGGLSGSFGRSKSKTNSSESGTSSSTANIIRFDEKSKQTLDELVNFLSGNVKTQSQEYSKGAATADANGIVAQIFQSFRNEMLPEIVSTQGKIGGYNNTSTQLLANDAFASTNVKAASAVLENIAKYAEIETGKKKLDIEGLLASLDLEKAAVEKQTETSSYSSRGTSSSKTTGGSIGLSLGGGGK